MYLTLIVAIVTSKYIFRCPKVSILIENIYISNQLIDDKDKGNHHLDDIGSTQDSFAWFNMALTVINGHHHMIIRFTSDNDLEK